MTTVSSESADGSLSVTHPDGSKLVVVQAADPRFGMQAPYASSSKLTTPAGLTLQTSTTRTTLLNDATDVLSLKTLLDSTVINGKTYQSAYDALTKTWTDTSAEGRTGNATTDTQGRPIRAQTTGLNPATLAYDPRGRLQTVTAGTGTNARSSTFTYHADGAAKGYLHSVTDAAGRVTQFQQDAIGRITQQTLPDGRSIGYSYDANGNLQSLTPPGRSAHVFRNCPEITSLFSANSEWGKIAPRNANQHRG